MDGGSIALFSRPPSKKKSKKAVSKPQHAEPQEPAQRPAAEEAPGGGLCDAAARDCEQQQEPETFRQLGLNEWLDRVCASLGMQRPTEVQRGCIPAVLAGRNVIGVAHTGSGKTAAFALPILQKLARDPYGVFALVLTPTRCVSPARPPTRLPAAARMWPACITTTDAAEIWQSADPFLGCRAKCEAGTARAWHIP